MTQKTDNKPTLDQVQQETISTMAAIQNVIEEEQQLPKLYAKMNAIMGAVTYIQKDKKNDFHKYSYASEEAIKKAIQKELIANKVLFLPSTMEVINRLEQVNERGKKSYLTTVEVRYKFIDVETGAFIEGSYQGDGSDPVDKGIYKALTGTLKYILTSNFLIPTGADPEHDPGEGKPDAATKAKPAAQKATTGKQWMKEAQVKEVIKNKIPGADAKQLDAVVAWMGAFRISNVNKFSLEQAIAIRRQEVDGTPIPAALLENQKQNNEQGK